ncbi:MAG: ABC transporter ATP-binding protein [Bacteroidetes bacterium]|nr:ABC transporter ATP-binding protein [Bacteroidota bacterium]
MRNIRKLIAYIYPYGGYAALNVLFNLLSAVFNVFSLTMVIPFLQILFQKDKPITELPAFALNKDSLMAYLDYTVSYLSLHEGKHMTLLFLCLFVVVLFLLKNFFFYLALYFLAPIRTGVIKDLRNDLYKKLLILPLSFYSESRRGDLISRATTDIQEVESSIMRSFELFFREPLTIVLFLFTLFFISTYLTLFVLILLPFAGLLLGRIARILRRKSIESQRKMGQLLSVVEETISGLRILKAFNAIDIANDKFREMNEDYSSLMTGLGRKNDLSSPLSEFLGVTILMIILVTGGYMVLNKSINLSAEAFIGFIVIFSQLINPAKNISTAYSQVQRGLSSLDRVQQVLDAEEIITDLPDARPVNEFRREIIFHHVHFSYGQEEVLTDINLVIPKGQVLALVGSSGGGKSTLVDLLPRFYDPVGGYLTIDGTPLMEYRISAVRHLYGIVTQEPILFNDTVYNNISFGWKEADMEKIKQAAVTANAHEFISQMPNGYYSRIGDRGSKLSGGQRQRLSIARAILRNPPILILDEATSALDSESEKQVQLGLEQAMKGRTTIIIAHRFSTIQHVDRIIVMDKGCIAESGSHEALISLNGIYKKLYDLQSLP